MSQIPVDLTLDERGVASVTFNRPELNNAYNGELLEGVIAGLERLQVARELRAVLLRGAGRHFQAGADLGWINHVRAQSPAANLAASRLTFEVVQRLNTVRVPTVALVQGACFGGGTGIVAACDIVVAADTAQFAITEVRWGLVAAIIVPQLVDAIGLRQVRRYALTGERFGALEARRIGLVHEVVPAADLAAAGEQVIAQLLANGPDALVETKQMALASSWGGLPADAGAWSALIEAHAAKRQTAEAAEGLESFIEKRAARWAPAREDSTDA